MTSRTPNKFSPELRERAVRLVPEYANEYSPRWQGMVSIATKTGGSVCSLNG